MHPSPFPDCFLNIFEHVFGTFGRTIAKQVKRQPHFIHINEKMAVTHYQRDYPDKKTDIRN